MLNMLRNWLPKTPAPEPDTQDDTQDDTLLMAIASRSGRERRTEAEAARYRRAHQQLAESIAAEQANQ